MDYNIVCSEGMAFIVLKNRRIHVSGSVLHSNYWDVPVSYSIKNTRYESYIVVKNEVDEIGVKIDILDKNTIGLRVFKQNDEEQPVAFEITQRRLLDIALSYLHNLNN